MGAGSARECCAAVGDPDNAAARANRQSCHHMREMHMAGEIGFRMSTGVSVTHPLKFIRDLGQSSGPCHTTTHNKQRQDHEADRFSCIGDSKAIFLCFSRSLCAHNRNSCSVEGRVRRASPGTRCLVGSSTGQHSLHPYLDFQAFHHGDRDHRATG